MTRQYTRYTRPTDKLPRLAHSRDDSVSSDKSRTYRTKIRPKDWR